MGELHSYQFPTRPSSGVLFGLSVARLAAVGAAGVVFIVAMARPTASSLAGALVIIGVLLASVAVRVGGRAAIDWIPVWAAYGWSMATRNNEFYASPDFGSDLPAEALDLPGELFGIEVHSFTATSGATVANLTLAGYGVIRDTFRSRLVAVAEISAADFLFCDPADQQARVSAWGALLDHVAQSLPELCRLQVVHTAGHASVQSQTRHHHDHGSRGSEATATSYREVLAASGAASQEHRVLLAVALDLRAARRAISQAGGGMDGAA